MAQSLVFCVVFCLSLFVFQGFVLSILSFLCSVLSVVVCFLVFCEGFVSRGVRAAQSLVFCVVFCLSLFVFSLLNPVCRCLFLEGFVLFNL